MTETKHGSDTVIAQEPAQWSFVALMALLMSFVALAIDAMLPALNQIGHDLHVQYANDTQLVISSIFFGMGLGLLFFGPFSDSYGRKPAIYIGMGIFFVGCLASIFSTTFEVMICGRVLQGLGGASCRLVTMAIIRDRFEGAAMAKIMSMIIIVFIMVPALAPSIGQVILFVADWRAIFVFMLILGIICLIWFALKQPETLSEENRLDFSIGTIWNGIAETLQNKTTRGYTIISGLIFGSFVGYLSSSQQILQMQYKLGDMFPVYFGFLALAIGVASMTNAKLVEKHGMEAMCTKAIFTLVVVALLFLPYCFYTNGHPPLIMLMGYLLVTFFCFGILFGNLNALAIEPLGHIAGVASSVIGSMQTLLSVGLGGFIGYAYNGSILPLVSGFLLLGLSAMILLAGLIKKRDDLAAYS